jgi:hypothetical protein
MVTPNLLKEFYEDSEKQALETIRYLQRDMGRLATIREENPDDWEVEELTRHIIFEEIQSIEALREEVEHARAARKELS